MDIVIVVVVAVVADVVGGIFSVVPKRYSTWISSTRTIGKLWKNKASEFIIFRLIFFFL